MHEQLAAALAAARRSTRYACCYGYGSWRAICMPPALDASAEAARGKEAINVSYLT